MIRNKTVYCDDLLYQVCYKIGADNSLVELSDSRGAATEELHPRNFIQGISLVGIRPMKRIIQPLLLEMEAISSPFIPRLAL